MQTEVEQQVLRTQHKCINVTECSWHGSLPHAINIDLERAGGAIESPMDFPADAKRRSELFCESEFVIVRAVPLFQFRQSYIQQVTQFAKEVFGFGEFLVSNEEVDITHRADCPVLVDS